MPDETTATIHVVAGDEYTQDPGTEYRKTATVRARAMPRDFEVETLEGTMAGEAGDYLAGPGAEGEFWPVKASIFTQTYEPVGIEDPEELRARATKVLADNLGEATPTALLAIQGATEVLRLLGPKPS